MVNEELRARLGGPHLQIGPSHFMQRGLTEAQIEQVWKYSIFPFVEEQLYGDEAGIRDYHFSQVMKRLRSKTGAAEDIEEDGAGSDQAPGVG
jgi:5-methylcytosine-specific restriction protein B